MNMPSLTGHQHKVQQNARAVDCKAGRLQGMWAEAETYKTQSTRQRQSSKEARGLATSMRIATELWECVEDGRAKAVEWGENASHSRTPKKRKLEGCQKRHLTDTLPRTQKVKIFAIWCATLDEQRAHT